MGKRCCEILLGLVVGGCASAPKAEVQPVADAKPTVVSEQVILGEPIMWPRPLPVEYRVSIENKLSNDSTHVDSAYRGWDVNRDGRLDRVDVLDAHGEIQASAFDFDFDGKFDMVREKR